MENKHPLTKPKKGFHLWRDEPKEISDKTKHKKIYESKRHYNERNPSYYKDWYKLNGRYRAADYVEAIIEWKIRNPKAIEAQYKVREAIANGKLIRPELCTKCHEKKRITAYHIDYNRPFVIIWLCIKCREEVHMKKLGMKIIKDFF